MLQRERKTAILPLMQPNASVRRAWSWVLVAIVAGLAACSAGSNVQFLPIGSRCSSNNDCGTKPYNCVTVDYPGGYCQKDCVTDGDCPADSACVQNECRRTCAGTVDCRAAEGYGCAIGAGTPKLVCDISAKGDGGSSN